MQGLQFLARRDDDDGAMSSTVVNLLIALLVLVLLILGLVSALLFMRRRRRGKQSVLPVHNGQCSTSSHHRGVTVSTNKQESLYVIDEKKDLVENSNSSPTSPVPEIRITFPDEEDASGKRTSGKMVTVRISDKGGVGLEPCDEKLPPYQSNGNERLQSLDLERMGGLKEKQEESKVWS